MESRRLDRRRALQLSGLAGAVAIAGCLGGDDDDSGNGDANGNDSDNGGQNDTSQNGDDNGTDNGTENGEDENGDDQPEDQFEEGDLGTIGEIPAFSDYVSENSEEETFAIYLDVEAVEAEEDLLSEQSEGDEPLVSEDLLIEIPASGLLFFGFLPFQLGTSGLGAMVGTTAEEDFESSVTDIIVADDALVLSGDVVTSEVADTLQTVSEDAVQEVPFVEVDTMNGFALYQPESPDSPEPETYAVSEAEVVRADTRAAVERMIETISGAVPPTADTYEDFAWALSAAGHGDIVVGGYNPDGFNENSEGGETDDTPLSDLEATVPGLISSITFQSDTVDAETAFVFENPPDSDARGIIQSAYGGDAEEVSYTYDSNYIYMSGTYTKSIF